MANVGNTKDSAHSEQKSSGIFIFSLMTVIPGTLWKDFYHFFKFGLTKHVFGHNLIIHTLIMTKFHTNV